MSDEQTLEHFKGSFSAKNIITATRMSILDAIVKARILGLLFKVKITQVDSSSIMMEIFY